MRVLYPIVLFISILLNCFLSIKKQYSTKINDIISNEICDLKRNEENLQAAAKKMAVINEDLRRRLDEYVKYGTCSNMQQSQSETVIADLRLQIEQLLSRTDLLQVINAQVKSNHTEINTKITQQIIRNDNLQEECARVKKELFEAKKELSACRNSFDRATLCKDELAANTKSIEAIYNDEKIRILKQLAEAEERYVELQQKFMTVESNNIADVTQLNLAMEKFKSETTIQIQEYIKTISQKDDDVDKLKRGMESIFGNIEFMSNVAMKLTASNYHKLLDQRNLEYENLRSASKKEIENQNAELQKLRGLVNTQFAEIGVSNKIIEKLEGELSTANYEISYQRNQNEAINKRIEELEGELSTANSDHKNQDEANNKRIKELNVELSTAKANSEERIKHLEGELSKASNVEITLNTELAKLKKEMEESADKTVKSSEVEQLEARLQANTTALAKRDNELDVAKREILTLQTQLRRKNYEETLQTIKTLHDNIISKGQTYSSLITARKIDAVKENNPDKLKIQNNCLRNRSRYLEQVIEAFQKSEQVILEYVKAKSNDTEQVFKFENERAGRKKNDYSFRKDELDDRALAFFTNLKAHETYYKESAEINMNRSEELSAGLNKLRVITKKLLVPPSELRDLQIWTDYQISIIEEQRNITGIGDNVKAWKRNWLSSAEQLLLLKL